MRRIVLPLLAVAALLVAFRPYVARADGDGEGPTVDARLTLLQAQVKSLKADVAFLLAREANLTRSGLALQTAAQNLSTGTGAARVAGFEAAAVPQLSRTAVLRTIDQLAKDLGGALPTVTREEEELRKKADAMRRELMAIDGSK